MSNKKDVVNLIAAHLTNKRAKLNWRRSLGHIEHVEEYQLQVDALKNLLDDVMRDTIKHEKIVDAIVDLNKDSQWFVERTEVKF